MSAIAQPHAAGVKPFRIGLVFDLSGKREPALDVVKGIELAASLLPAGSRPVEFTKYNSGSDALGTREAMLEILKNPPDIIIAEIDSSKAVIAAAMAEEAGRVMITPMATSPVVTEGRKMVFRTCFSDTFQGQKLAAFARHDLKGKTAVIYADGGQLYSKTLGEAFRKNFQSLGGTILLDEKITSSAPSFKAQLDRVMELKPDVVFLPVYEQTAARFVNESVLRGVTGTAFLGGDGWGASQAFKDIVFRKNAPVSAYWVSHYSGDLSGAKLAPLVEAYRKSTGEQFNASTAVGYDTFMVAYRALSATKSIRQDEIVSALHKMTYQGVSGAIAYRGHQDPQKSIFIRKVDHDKMGFVTELMP